MFSLSCTRHKFSFDLIFQMEPPLVGLLKERNLKISKLLLLSACVCLREKWDLFLYQPWYMPSRLILELFWGMLLPLNTGEILQYIKQKSRR